MRALRSGRSPSSWCSGPITTGRLWQVALACRAFVLLLVATLAYSRPDFAAGLLRFSDKSESRYKFYRWDTKSQFKPVHQATAQHSIEELCKAFPHDLPRDIQPVLKTGHGLGHTRIETHLQSVLVCLEDNLLVLLDADEEIGGYEVIDLLADLRTEFVKSNDQLESYVLQKELADNDTLHTEAASRIKGWQTDKSKFLPQVSRAWRMRPEKRWYVFYEDDTYIVWDNMFRLLTNFDPDMPWYFGSPSPGARGLWMTNGGPGYVLSREAVRRLVKDDFDANGAFVESALTRRWEDQMMHDCCGDSVLGLALHEDTQKDLSGLYLMFQPHSLYGIPFNDRYWRQPVISMHRNLAEDMVPLRKWEESRRDMRRPLPFADLVDYFNLTKVAIREGWTNTDFGGYAAPLDTAHASFDACSRACKNDPNCFGWMHHLRTCRFVNTIRLGQAKAPEVEASRSEEDKAVEWNDEEKRYRVGWDLEGIRRWMSAEGRDCKTIEWVRPSLERIF